MVLIFVPTMLLLPCSNPSIVGVNIHEEFKEEIFDGNNVLDENFSSIDQPCNEQCDCSTKLFDPICNKATGLSYVSPCHAGCRLYQANENPRCSCIEGDIELEDGFCDSDCPIWRYWVFILLLFVSIACGMGKIINMFPSNKDKIVFTPLVPSAIMRSTSSKLKGFQQAIQLLFIRLFGAIPGTLLIGWLIDSSCLLWTTEDDGSQAACFSYGNSDFVLMLLIPAMVVKGAAIIAYAFASWFAKNKEIETIEIKRSKSLVPEVMNSKPEVTIL